MIHKTLCVFLLAAVVSSINAGVVPAVPAAYVANYASSYNAQVVNHAIAAPVISAPYIAAPAVAAAPVAYAAAPAVAAAAPLIASPAAVGAYSVHPY